MKNLIVSLVFLSTCSFSETPKQLATYGNWSVYKTATLCFMQSVPIKSVGDYKVRGEIRATISCRLSSKSTDKPASEFSFTAGYKHSPNKKGQLQIGNEHFNLITNEDTAWMEDLSKEAELIKLCEKKDQLIIKSISAKGTETVDTFSLKGFSKAYADMMKVCHSSHKTAPKQESPRKK
ncbi:MAG: hypothetical protein HYS39_00335 [Proteobacteria bacterium]|nr:hypothetical protein [Pseudomonadota bacterium]